jgi:A/G-specific adenine glycosylase
VAARRQSDFGISEAQVAAFRKVVWDYYRVERRDLPWRRARDPYAILVSEVMLQQTQVARVLAKYDPFLAAFPTVQALATAALGDVLEMWSGLGYNRRALSLQRTAAMIVADHRGCVPSSVDLLLRFPGIGAATAAAVCVFAFGQAQVFVETNIRSAFIHYFFAESEHVADTEIMPLVDLTMERDDPREWFYALMDYGVWVKKSFGNPGRRSKHHAVQTPFAGSRRELRAKIVQTLVELRPAAADLETLRNTLSGTSPDPVLLTAVLEDLAVEGFLTSENGRYRIA